MKYVIYLGVIFMPDGNAAAQRANAFSELIQKNGYKPVIIGMNKKDEKEKILDTFSEENGTILYSMNYPNNFISWMKLLFSYQDVIEVIEHLGKRNVYAVVAMDYYAIALKRIIHYCEKNNIKFVADAVDWFAKSRYKFPKGLIKNFDTKYRMEYIYKNVDCMIAISELLADFYKPYVKKIVQIPGVYLKNSFEKKQQGYIPNKILTLGFVGDPGKYCEIEKIDWVIKAICKLNCESIRVRLYVAGIEEETLKIYRPDIVGLKHFKESTEFKGRISHEECIELISKCDFSIIIREDNLLSNAGFPTKLGESFACGTPVIVTPTSNIVKFIPKDYGVVTEACTYDAVEKVLNLLLEYSASDKERVHSIVSRDNPLDCCKFIAQMGEILKDE